jgi:hypothetical protein
MLNMRVKLKAKCLECECDRPQYVREYCIMHYTRLRRAGAFTESNAKGWISSNGYRNAIVGYSGSRAVYAPEHRVVAEKALGKPLPPEAVVHHINGDTLDNRPENLVICPNQAYHLLIHKLMREKGIKWSK